MAGISWLPLRVGFDTLSCGSAPLDLLAGVRVAGAFALEGPPSSTFSAFSDASGASLQPLSFPFSFPLYRRRQEGVSCHCDLG